VGQAIKKELPGATVLTSKSLADQVTEVSLTRESSRTTWVRAGRRRLLAAS